MSEQANRLGAIRIWRDSPQALRAMMILLFLAYSCGLEIWMNRVLGVHRAPHPGFALSFYFVVLGLAFVFPERVRWYWLSAAVTALTLMFTIDDVYFRFFGTLPSIRSGIPLSQVLVVWRSAVELLRPANVMWCAGTGVFWWTSIVIARARRRLGPEHVNQAHPLLIAGGFFAMAACGLILAVDTDVPRVTHHPDNLDVWNPLLHWRLTYSNLDAASFFGLAMYHVRDLQKLAAGGFHDTEYTDQDLRIVRAAVARSREINQRPSLLNGIAAGRNVVVVLLEAMQYFVIDLEVNGEEVTPFLNRLYRDSLHWHRFYDNTGLGRTSDAEFSLHSGIDSDEGRAVAFQRVDEHIQYMPRLLAKNGYESYSFHGYRKDFWNRANTHRTYGFDHLYFEEELPQGRQLAIGLADEVVFSAFAERLAASPQPFYGFMITLSGHHPFTKVPAKLQDRFSLSCGDEAEMLRGYLQLAHYVDRELERFVTRMAELGLAENTVFVFFGDHDLGPVVPGKAPEVYRHFFALLSSCLGANPFAPQEDRMPLCILIPGREDEIAARAHEYENVLGCSSDIFPTLFDLLGLPIPGSMQGRQLFHSGGHLVNLSNYFNPLDRQVYQRCVNDEGVFLLHPGGWQGSGVIDFDGGISGLSSAAEYDALRQAAHEKRLVADYLRHYGTADPTSAVPAD